MKRIFLAAALMVASITAALAQGTVTRIGPITSGDCAAFSSPNTIQDAGFNCSGVPAVPFASPTGTVGLAIVNGAATTAMRSDAAPPLSASVQSALTGATGLPAFGTGAFGFNARALLNSDLPQAAANSVKCNPTNAAASSQDCAIGALHSKDFGATGNGSTDDTTNLQTWVTACQTRILVCYLDAGTYKISSALSITGYIYLTGAGRISAILAPSNATQNTFTISTTVGYGQIQNISNQPSVTKTGGAFISLTSPGANNQFWTFRDLSTNGNDFNGFSFGAASNFTLDNVLEPCLNICVGTGVTGDSVITNSIIQPAATNAVAISIGINGSSSANGSGLRIVNNKINSGNTGVIGIQLSGTALCASCSDLMIANNSIEVLGNAILLGPANSATSYVNITIVGNELNGNAGVNNTDSTSWLGTVAITGNTIVPIGGPGINFQNVKNFVISGNVFTGVSGANVGINLSALVTGCVIGPNQFSAFTTNFADASGTCRGQAGQLPGTATNDNASTGSVAEFFSASVAPGSAISLTNGTPINLNTGISLTAGDWDVSCDANFVFAATTSYTQLLASISATSATTNQTAGSFAQISSASNTPGTSTIITVKAGPARVSLASTTTEFCVLNQAFATSTLTGWGILRARRVR